MKLGLSENNLQLIVDTLSQAGVSKAVVFGSRAKGNWRENSDIDIAVFGAGVNVGALSVQLDELPMPYKFDIVDYNSINNQALREHIDMVGVEIYKQ
ncbi:nucleotidyltransferase domain-containing protein [Phascolarctobacterium sp.]|uniref:nucleotidyltransferase family protein n=1 Tax=Phascolarctobacterium sp. TaxID=2049039 RepID=UPI003077CB50